MSRKYSAKLLAHGSEPVPQVSDETHILLHMMKITENADILLRPTNYWSNYRNRFLRELRKKGLKDFRRRKDSVLESFGAVDLDPYPSFTVRLPRGGGLIGRWMTRSIDKLPALSLNLRGVGKESFVRYGYWQTKRAFSEKGIDIGPCQTDRIGNPADVYEIDGSLWSLAQLRDCTTYLGFVGEALIPNDAIICELGPGLGRTAGIMASYYPEQTIILFDIPPQLYVLNQYLKKRFGNRVLPYEEAITIAVDGQTSIPEEFRTKIIVLPTASMPQWSNIKIDLFWNSASFQEMETEAVENYLSLVRKMQPEVIFISASPGGNFIGDVGRGAGNKKIQPNDLYLDCLKHDYSLKTEKITDVLFKTPGTKTYIFKRL